MARKPYSGFLQLLPDDWCVTSSILDSALNGNLLLALATMAVESLQQYREAGRKLVRLVQTFAAARFHPSQYCRGMDTGYRRLDAICRADESRGERTRFRSRARTGPIRSRLGTLQPHPMCRCYRFSLQTCKALHVVGDTLKRLPVGFAIECFPLAP